MANDAAKLSGPNFSLAMELSTIAARATPPGRADGEPVLRTWLRVVAGRQGRTTAHHILGQRVASSPVDLAQE